MARKSNGQLFNLVHRFVAGGQKLHLFIFIFESQLHDAFLQDIFAITAPIYSFQRDTGQDSNAMLVSALSILSYVVLSPELGSERETDRILQQRSGNPAAPSKQIARKAEQLLGVSRDASDSCLWSLLNVLCSLLDAVELRHPTRRTASAEVSTLRDDALGSWELLNSHCFSAIRR